jgi:hypothetical protein
MKSIIPLLAVTVLAAFALVGCNQNSPTNSTTPQTTNTSDAYGTSAGVTNMLTTNGLPDTTITNTAAVTNQ